MTGKELAKVLEQLPEAQKDFLVVFVDKSKDDTSYTIDDVKVYQDLGFIFLNSVDEHLFNVFEK